MVGSATFTASAELGSASSFTALKAAPKVTLTTDVGAVKVSMSPSSVVVGTGHAVATMVVSDPAQLPLAGHPLTLAGSSGQTFGPITDHGDGTYTATVTASTKAGTAKISATSLGVKGSANLKQTPGPATTLAFQGPINPLPASADTATEPLTVRAADQYGNGVPHDPGVGVRGRLESDRDRFRARQR